MERVTAPTRPDVEGIKLLALQIKHMAETSSPASKAHGEYAMKVDAPAMLALVAWVETLSAALELPLMFHSGGVWTAEKRLRWMQITGTDEATSKVMCDTIRALLPPPAPR